MADAARRVLVVDDHTDSTEMMSLLLEGKGHQARVASDGEEAISVADTFRPDVVILDLGLPRLDGYEVARRLRQRPYGGALVIVALTGWSGKDVHAKAADAGFDYHLLKPVMWEDLDKLLATAPKNK